jgi:hypothetical protein
MASIRARSNKWQARIIRIGHPILAKTFLTRNDADKLRELIDLDVNGSNNRDLNQKIEIVLLLKLTKENPCN